MGLQFKELSSEDQLILTDALALITILVGSADGALDIEETEWASRVTKFRAFSHNDDLTPYYVQAGENFDTRLDEILRRLPAEMEPRSEEISKRLAMVNPIMESLDEEMAFHLYNDWLTYAAHVAKASGGVFHMASISPNEKKWMQLPMITPIEDRGI